MQYILKQIEYDELVHLKEKHQKRYLNELQKVCTMACDNTPILYWDKTIPEPWGCIITIEKENEENGTDEEWCCDECPTIKVCPYEYKTYSK